MAVRGTAGRGRRSPKAPAPWPDGSPARSLWAITKDHWYNPPMPRFLYKAVSPDGEIIEGEFDAADRLTRRRSTQDSRLIPKVLSNGP